jgi:hypothetical protein
VRIDPKGDFHIVTVSSGCRYRAFRIEELPRPTFEALRQTEQSRASLVLTLRVLPTLDDIDNDDPVPRLLARDGGDVSRSHANE